MWRYALVMLAGCALEDEPHPSIATVGEIDALQDQIDALQDQLDVLNARVLPSTEDAGGGSGTLMVQRVDIGPDDCGGEEWVEIPVPNPSVGVLSYMTYHDEFIEDGFEEWRSRDIPVLSRPARGGEPYTVRIDCPGVGGLAGSSAVLILGQ